MQYKDLQPLHIAQVVYTFPVYSESFIMDQITGLIAAGHEVGVFGMDQPTEKVVHPQVAEYGILDHTRYLPAHANSKRGLVKQALRAVFARPALFGRVGLRSGYSFRDRLHMLARLRGYVSPATPDYDLVHCQFGDVALTQWISKQAWDAKLIVNFRGHDFSSEPLQRGESLYDAVFTEADAVLVVCAYAIDKLVALGCPREKILVHHSGTDIADFAFRERMPSPSGEVRLLTVARLEETKGITYTLQAVAHLIHDHKLDVRYDIVGHGSLEQQLKQQAEGLKIDDRVVFHGARSRPDVREMLHSHHIFVLPSVTASDGAQEGIPGSVREAMATGMPVISTVHSGIPELVVDGESGYLVPEHDVDALADRLQDLATNPEQWAEMGRSGRAQVEQGFEINGLNERLVRIYRHVIAGKVPAEFEG